MEREIAGGFGCLEVEILGAAQALMRGYGFCVGEAGEQNPLDTLNCVEGVIFIQSAR